MPCFQAPLDLDAELGVMLSTPSGAFGPRNTPEFLLHADVIAMERCRKLQVGTFNTLLEAMGFEAYTRMEQFSPDKEAVAVLKAHYGDRPDQVELMAGILADVDDTNQGWGAPAKMAFAIVADALSACRHDRFYTTDFTAEVYTDWGLEHGKTSVLADLLLRHTGIKLPPGANPRTFPTGKIVR